MPRSSRLRLLPLRSFAVPARAPLALSACLLAAGAAQAAGLAALDIDHDGRLSREEVASRPMLARHFDEIDANHDGYLTREELLAWRQARRAEHAGRAGGAGGAATSPGAAPMGSEAVAPGGPPPAGPIAAAPGAAPMAGPPPARPGAAADRFFHKVDSNGNGVIERSEAAAHPALARHFDEIDTNHDGVISPDELAAARAARVARRQTSAPPADGPAAEPLEEPGAPPVPVPVPRPSGPAGSQ